MITNGKVIGFVPTIDAARARPFYEKQLGLAFLGEDAFALTFDANGNTPRIVRVGSDTPAPFTILGWNVNDIRSCATQLQRNGIPFHRYHGLAQDEIGIRTSPAGSRIAWFADPDGNVLSISEG